jgi:CheY-like chemotaxis protein
VLLNLAINARDAMPEGGDLTVRLIDEEQHIRIDVTDTGRGMDEATRAKCFEPFFTTKGRAGGTGLGLATVYNVVTSAGGRVAVETEAGAGTCFTVLLPRETHVYDVEPTESAARHGNGHVLLVEDEDGLRRLATEALRSAGFVVTSAADGVAALQLVATTGEAPDLLVTDVVMPRLNGVDLARQLTREHPGLQVLFVSGYAESATRDDLEGADVLTKPFALDELTERVAEMLGRSLDERPA